MITNIWIKITTISIIIILALLSVFLYKFLFNYDPQQYMNVAPNLPNLDLDTYNSLQTK
jgi:hypothetical protein